VATGGLTRDDGAWGQEVKEGFVPFIRETPEFVSYFVLTPRQGEIASLSVF
jgi:hypothetical protein